MTVKLVTPKKFEIVAAAAVYEMIIVLAEANSKCSSSSVMVKVSVFNNMLLLGGEGGWYPQSATSFLFLSVSVKLFKHATLTSGMIL